MLKGINHWTWPRGTPLAQSTRIAAQAGFAAYEPCLDAEGELTLDTPEPATRALGEVIRSAGLEVSSLASGAGWQLPLTAAPPRQRAKAIDAVRQALDRAAWIGAPVLLVVPGVVAMPRQPKEPRARYEDALARVYDALTELAFDAEARAVHLAIENVWNQFLLSPVEMRELIDRVHSPWVGVYFDTGNILKFGFPQDWIETLARRILRVHIKDFKLEVGTLAGFCMPPDGDVDWPAVMAALRSVGYAGPLTHEGPGEPADISRRLDGLLGL